MIIIIIIIFIQFWNCYLAPKTAITTRVVPEVPDLTKKKKHFGKKMSLFLYIVSF
jgi:hypothetical protein